MKTITDQEIKKIFTSRYHAEIQFAPGELPEEFEVGEIAPSTAHMVEEWIRAGELPEWSTFEALLYLAREGWIEQGCYNVEIAK